MSNFYKLFRPILFLLPPETAHSLSLWALKSGLMGKRGPKTSNRLKSKLWGLSFPNPIGLAAGYDKNAEVPLDILNIGFGFAETGTITPKPQPGNPRPRIFRLLKDRAVINRLGFNNKGLNFAKSKLEKIRTNPKSGLIGANVGANKTSEDRTNDYVVGLKALEGLADYYVINISSPNTPGLRALQSRNALENLLEKTIQAKNQFGKKAPLLLKVAPDLTNEDIVDISEVALEKQIDGLIISNTTISRPNSLIDKNKLEEGGLSGAPLFDLSTETLRAFFKIIGGKVPLIGVGGIDNGEKAYKKILSGASLVQIYSGLVYEGPNLANKIAVELDQLLKENGYASVGDAVGKSVT